MVRRRKEQWHQQKGYMFSFRNRGRREKRQNVNFGSQLRQGVLHFIGHQFLLVSHAIGEHVLVLIQAFYSIGFKMDAAGNVLDVLHVCPDQEIPQIGKLTVRRILNCKGRTQSWL